MAQKAEERWIGHVLNQTYRIDSILGKGGQAIVYRGVDLTTQATVAIKQFWTKGDDESQLERFRREARHQMDLIHEHIVRMYSMIEEDDEHFLVMEYVDGTDLGHLISVTEDLPRQPLANIKSIFLATLSALGYAHSKGIIHRDIKPANIMLTQDYQVKLADFGLARQLSDHRLTRVGQMLGTPAYTAPEILHGDANFDPRCDIYSVGVSLYETICGTTPFLNPGEVLAPYELLGRSMFMEPESPRERDIQISESLDQVVMKSIAKDPNERYQSCEEFYDALGRAICDEDLQQPTPMPSADRHTIQDTTIIARPDFAYDDGAAEVSLSSWEDEKTEYEIENVKTYADLPSESEEADSGQSELSSVEVSFAKEDTEDVPQSSFDINARTDVELPAAGFPKRRSLWPGRLIALVFVVFVVGVLALGLRSFLRAQKLPQEDTQVGVADAHTSSPPTDDGDALFPQRLPGVPMVYVPSGSFFQGLDLPGSDFSPQREVYLTAFWIDQFEVTVRQYRACVRAGACASPAAMRLRDQHRLDVPVVRVSWSEASHFCRWMQKRLPTEAEWEKAARGIDTRWYPWGKSPPRCDYANRCGCLRGVGRVGPDQRSLGRSRYGAHDMSGNVWEWTRDCYDRWAYRRLPLRDPISNRRRCQVRVLRGGSWACQNQWGLKIYTRRHSDGSLRRDDVGFRCAWSSASTDPSSP